MFLLLLKLNLSDFINMGVWTNFLSHIDLFNVFFWGNMAGDGSTNFKNEKDTSNNNMS